jgi:hypothetical protein
MDLKSKIKKTLREHYGNFNTKLEHDYEDKITEILILNNHQNTIEWLTYNQVILEIKNSLNDMIKVKELQYKLTEDINPNIVCLEVIESLKNLSPELERLYYKIKNF